MSSRCHIYSLERCLIQECLLRANKKRLVPGWVYHYQSQATGIWLSAAGGEPRVGSARDTARQNKNNRELSHQFLGPSIAATVLSLQVTGLPTSATMTTQKTV